MRWWHEARFGMFVHWGLYAQLGRGEWAMNREGIPVEEYEALSWTWKPKPRPAREWARLAAKAGMRYAVLTTKHHDGFCLWDTKQTDYNAAARGPGRDLVREYAEACREFGLRVGLYYSLIDWHHPDCAPCAKDEGARRRFLDFTQGCLRELLTQYGQIDILWYDGGWCLPSPEAWESEKMNRMARALQPGLIINNRALLPEDFGTPEREVKAEPEGRSWEACMTFNGDWGYVAAPPEDWISVRSVLRMLCTCTGGGGNLLLNIGPQPDGSVPSEAVERLSSVGRWLARYGEPVYGKADRTTGVDWIMSGEWTRKGNTLYYWVTSWSGTELSVGGLRTKLRKATLLADGREVAFTQTRHRLVLHDLPRACPDKIAGISVIKLEFAARPRQVFP